MKRRNIIKPQNSNSLSGFITPKLVIFTEYKTENIPEGCKLALVGAQPWLYSISRPQYQDNKDNINQIRFKYLKENSISTILPIRSLNITCRIL